MWWNTAYSLLKAGAVFVHKDVLDLTESHAGKCASLRDPLVPTPLSFSLHVGLATLLTRPSPLPLLLPLTPPLSLSLSPSSLPHTVLSPPLTTTLGKHPECYSVGLSFFVASLTQRNWDSIGMPYSLLSPHIAY